MKENKTLKSNNSISKINYLLVGISIFISYFGICALLPSYAIHTLPLFKEYTFNKFDSPPYKNYDSITTHIENNNIKYIQLGDLYGPETIAFNSKGDAYIALITSEIRYIKSPVNINGSGIAETHPYSFTGGRPLGIHFDNDDNLIIADSLKGLLKIDRDTKDLSILTSSVNGTKLNYVNDFVIDPSDGMIYFTDSTEIAPSMDTEGNWNTLYSSLYTCGAMLTSGKLLSYNPKTKETKLLLSGFAYSSGITLVDDSVLVVESCKYRIVQYFIKGENAGKSKVFIDSIDGFPNGIEFANDKLYISIFGQRLKVYDQILHQYPILKKIYFSIPYMYNLKSKPSFLIADHKTGEITKVSKCTSQYINSISSTTMQNDILYFGNLKDNYIAYIEDKTLLI